VAVGPLRWEFQIDVLSPPPIGDHLWAMRWLLFRIPEDFDVYTTLEPILGNWNGLGAHTNFSTKPSFFSKASPDPPMSTPCSTSSRPGGKHARLRQGQCNTEFLDRGGKRRT
jgi:hypothetical protein